MQPVPCLLSPPWCDNVVTLTLLPRKNLKMSESRSKQLNPGFKLFPEKWDSESILGNRYFTFSRQRNVILLFQNISSFTTDLSLSFFFFLYPLHMTYGSLLGKRLLKLLYALLFFLAQPGGHPGHRHRAPRGEVQCCHEW